MRSQQEKSIINRTLKNHGLPTLESGAGLLQALGSRVHDHEHFRSLLIRCDPKMRSAMYDSMAPYLRFKAHPLDRYIAESARRAEAEKLPTVDTEGKLHQPLTQNLIDAKRAVKEAFAKKFLTVTCRSCTKQESFAGATRDECVIAARVAGWVCFISDRTKKPVEICPSCPATRSSIPSKAN